MIPSLAYAKDEAEKGLPSPFSDSNEWFFAEEAVVLHSGRDKTHINIYK